ncbi:tetratricopeptide repeat-containing sensor histidine kinase [Kordia sp.]|uniref:tetratricopeptide repeat-containing sensor histidine kinase n=1 Tax=Kordia sp. TaxID=1965332 RepID=UPI003D2CAE5C
MKLIICTFLLFLSTLVVAQKAELSEAEAISLFERYEQKGEDFNRKRELDSMKVYLAKLDALLPKIQDSSYIYRADLIRGAVLSRKTQTDRALEVLLKATEFFRLQEDYKNYYRGRFKIAYCYYYANQREDTKEVMLEILENKQYVDEDLATRALEKVGAINIELGMHQKNPELLKDAIKRISNAITINRKNNKYTELASNYGLIAEGYNQLKELDKVVQLLDSSIYFAKKADNLPEEGFALIKKGKLYTDQKKYDQATSSLSKAVKIYKDTDDIPLLLYAYGEQKKLFQKTQQYKAASELGDEIYTLAITQYNKRFADGVSEMRTKYKTAEKEREILEQRAEIAEKGLLLQERKYQIYGALSLALLFCFLGYLFYNQQKLKNRQLVKENKLKVALKEIEIQNKLQEQRLRISRDLHDNIGAQLSFIISSIDNLKYASKDTSNEFKDKLSYISEFTLSTIDQLRDTIWAMNKDEISITDLQSRTLAFIEKAKVAKQTVKFEFDSAIKTPIVFTAVEGMHLFRVIQEAINNALKYATPKTVKVNFSEKENTLILAVIDDGIGFEKEAVQLGNGLYNMQKRMDEINAHISINSKPSEGTEITVKFKILNANL